MNVLIATSAAVLVGCSIYAAAQTTDPASTDNTSVAGAQNSRHHRFADYTVIKLRDFEGNESGGNSINDEGLIAGFTHTPANDARHATLWLHGFPFDLGTLGGPNSNVAWPVKNTIGLIAGIAQTADPEPLGQGWSCRAFFNPATSTGRICKAVVWERGEITALPTLGGHNGFATGANNKRQVVGWTETGVEDPSCVRPRQVLQFLPVVWGPDLTQVRALPLLQGDSVGSATAINDKGQVVGISGACGTAVGGVSARRVVLWEKGKVKDLGSLGGIAWNTPMAINERGEVVGFSNTSAADGANFNAQAFIWTRGRGMRNLGTLEGDVLSQALGINIHGQVVGISCTAGFASCRAFLWQNGRMVDLNSLVTGGSDEHLYTANDINDRGEITGQSLNLATQEFSAVWAIPGQSRHGHDSDSARSEIGLARLPPRPEAEDILMQSLSNAKAGERTRVVLPAHVRGELLRSLGLSEATFARGSQVEGNSDVRAHGS
jgi:probable HAF family extracellular repeat protein